MFGSYMKFSSKNNFQQQCVRFPHLHYHSIPPRYLPHSDCLPNYYRIIKQFSTWLNASKIAQKEQRKLTTQCVVWGSSKAAGSAKAGGKLSHFLPLLSLSLSGVGHVNAANCPTIYAKLWKLHNYKKLTWIWCVHYNFMLIRVHM